MSPDPDSHPQGKEYTDRFGGEVQWIRTITGSGLLLRIVRFDGSGAVEIPLRPAPMPAGRPRITIGLVNLCSINPLEWIELPLRKPEDRGDDFKWLYRLLRRKDGGSMQDLFDKNNPKKKRMPVPKQPDRAPPRAETMRVGMIQNCTPLRTSLAF